jgi:hypothetical protein
LNSTPATVTGMAGASSGTADFGHVGHNMYDTNVPTAAISTATLASASQRLREPRHERYREIACTVILVVRRCNSNQARLSHAGARLSLTLS